MMERVFFAAAKLNLSLQVLRVREDGFHEVRTLLVPLSLRDEISIKQSEKWSFSCEGVSLPVGENLAEKAAFLFSEQTQIPLKYEVCLRKKIPISAGLGGGSSDAACLLMALNKLEGNRFSLEELMALGKKLGSDVPFFFSKKIGWYGGRGDDFIEECENFNRRRRVLLVKPPFGISAREAYSFISKEEREEEDFSWENLRNDLQMPVFQKYVFLQVLSNWFRDREEVKNVLLAGSGSTLAVFLEDSVEEEEGKFVFECCEKKFSQNFWGEVVCMI